MVLLLLRIDCAHRGSSYKKKTGKKLFSVEFILNSQLIDYNLYLYTVGCYEQKHGEWSNQDAKHRTIVITFITPHIA